ncbi:hypothetical protein GCM10025857_38140 [Alicyclobacillus contaminans]|uniref:hypothetical protein n=1 Tax=Alicyclobacillus contaminans TaxID=392016 RepID=UPI00040DE900|nr:hypothetical protein [Alicyclobacillus contaminans]GMA52457.1 hypothetical protein GCM10025857_38140 [Alicyclobacillus contaminans]
MRFWSRVLRFFAATVVVLWGWMVLHAQIMNQRFRNPYQLPHPPYVAVVSMQHSPNDALQAVWELGAAVTHWMQLGNP